MYNHGYSDRINHALAFAAKHYDQQVRRGTRAPFNTHPANVAIILTRYGQSDDCVVAGILHEVISDYLRDGFTREQIEERISAKFGTAVVETLLPITERRFDDDGVELSHEERKEDLLSRLGEAGEISRWICAADKLHVCGVLLADLRRTEFREAVWERQPGGREPTLRWHKAVAHRLAQSGFRAAIMTELRTTIEEMERFPA
jgi:(p)ppGpp synthase/HD superfamily hydrolase